MMERLRALALLVVVGLALGGCAGQSASGPPNSAATAEAASSTELTMTEATRELARNQCEDWVIVEHAFSGSDDTDLVGFADNVFVGRVAERVGASGPGGPEPWGSTRFSVEVLENVKGKLGDSVTVSQDGAYDAERGCLMLAEDNPLLRPGQEVMFFTRRDEEQGWHQIVTPGYGDVRIKGEGYREELVRRFERARKNQTDPTPGRH